MSSPATGLRYNTRVMDGGLTLGITMTVIPRMGSPEALAELLLDELKKRNISYGIDEATVLRIMQDKTLNEEVMIARGTPPRTGSDAEVQLLLLPPSFMASADDKGQVDYKDIENVSEVKEGDVIARKTAADPGEPGFNVFGREVRPAPVRDAKLPFGRNTVLSEDGLELRAAKDGFLRWKGDKIEVVELYLVMGDVGPRTGNIRYQNEVAIHGDVQAGFEVVAGGDVQVFGSVDGGKVVSEQGTITVWRGVMGSSEGPGVVTALGDIPDWPSSLRQDRKQDRQCDGQFRGRALGHQGGRRPQPAGRAGHELRHRGRRQGGRGERHHRARTAPNGGRRSPQRSGWQSAQIRASGDVHACAGAAAPRASEPERPS